MPSVVRFIASILIAVGPGIALGQSFLGDRADAPLGPRTPMASGQNEGPSWPNGSGASFRQDAIRRDVTPANYETPAEPASRQANPFPNEAGGVRPQTSFPGMSLPAPGQASSAGPGSTPLCPTPLSPPSQTGGNKDGNRIATPGGISSLVRVGGSLALVLGLFLVVAWFMRRNTPGNCPVLPGEVLEVLGRASLAGRQQLHLLRLGSKLVLVCITPAGVKSLSEVTEPAEVDRLAGLCRQAQPNSSTAAFRQVFQQFTGTGRREETHG